MQGERERESWGSGSLTGNCNEVGGVVRNDELLVQKRVESKNLMEQGSKERRRGGQRKINAERIQCGGAHLFAFSTTRLSLCTRLPSSFLPPPSLFDF